ncbi:MAG: peptidoglycan editing factor PgeF [Candidatus Dadabacteria bacterium]|nr:peptidoglycan editing factor PgeF [Candidatus Dadabacteria bacterium]
MYFIQSAKLSVIEGIVHGFADRGVCADPIEIARHFKLSKIAQLKQVHRGDVIIVENIENHYALSEGDALVTELRGVGIGIRTADCVPILLVDDRQSVIAAIHGGWRGTLSEIAMNTVSLIESKYGISPSKLTAVIGPSIKKCCYEIGEDVASLFEERFQNFDQYLFKSKESKYFLDLSLANKLGLQKAGVSDIEVIDICTKCNDNFYSYRREGKGVNTQLSFIALKQ